MDSCRQQILINYISYLYTTGKSYEYIGRYIKYVTGFLESADSITRRGYLTYKRENADMIARHPLMCEAICCLLSFLKIGFQRKEKSVKPLEKLSVISDKNRALLNNFIVWLTDNNDYSPHTVDLYYTSLKNSSNMLMRLIWTIVGDSSKCLRKKSFLRLLSACALQQSKDSPNG